MSNSSTNPYGGITQMPPQRLSRKKKTKSWREDCVNAIFAKGMMRQTNGRTSWQRKQTNYDLVNSIIDENDFKHVMDPYGINNSDVGRQPGKLRQMNLIFNKLSLMKGEEMNRPFNYTVMGIGGNVLKVKDEAKKTALIQAATAKLYHEAGINPNPQIDPKTGEETPPPELEQIAKHHESSYQDIIEQKANNLLRYHEFHNDLKMVFNNAWEHSMVSSEDIIYVGVSNGKIKTRATNPLNVDYDRNPDEPRIEKGDWFREDRAMTAGQIIDEFADDMTEKQMDDLIEGNIRTQVTNGMLPEFAYEMSDFDASRNGSYAKASMSNQHYIVSQVCWRSLRKLGFMRFFDPETGEPSMETIFEESFKMPPELVEQGATIEWKWVPEIWEGVKIADDMIIRVKPSDNTDFDPDFPYDLDLPYIGRVMNGTNSIQTSMVDLIKPHQYLHIALWFKLEQELSKPGGKKIGFDMAMMPKSHGFDMEKWMYLFDNANIALVNSHEEGKNGANTGKNPTMDMMKVLDMSLSDSIGQYIQIMEKLEREIDSMLGITPQREGQVMASETASSVRHSQIQSSAITEPWFYMHNEVKKAVLQKVLNLSRHAYKGKKVLNYILDDVQRIMTEIDMDQFALSSFGVFVTNSSKDNKVFGKIEELALTAMQSEKTSFSSIIDALRSDSISEVSNIIKQGEKDVQASQAEAGQQQQQHDAKMEELRKEEAQIDRDHEKEITAMKIDGDIRKAIISAQGRDAQNTEGDDSAVIAQEGDRQLKLFAEENKVGIENRKIESQNQQASEANRLKEKEIESKERMNKDNNKTALKNKVAGEK